MLALVCLSGGMDSATLLPYALQNYGDTTAAVGFDYGSKHNKYELEMAHKLADHFDIPFRVVELPFVKEFFTSTLLKRGGEIPEGHYEDPSMATTVVPGRNLIMLSIAAGIVDSVGGGAVLMGMHAGDAAIYPDCRVDFIYRARMVLQKGYTNDVELITPFVSYTKSGILQYGALNEKVPYELTRTCYKDQELACGKCGACVERLEAFAYIGREDPLSYATL